MKRGLQGTRRLQATSPEPFHSFIPAPQPPSPTITFDSGLQDLLEKANRALGRLDGLAYLLPDLSLFLYFYVRKEAVLSSQIEGTQSSLSDLLLFESHEIPGVPVEDVQEVSNYVRAANLGIERIRGGSPLTGRLLRELHGELLSSGRGSSRQPGEFRRSQNWIGGTRPGNAAYVPPPHELVPELMSDLEKFIHDSSGRTSTLIKAGLAHVQFESIHPFLDGNGRVGRLLIPLILCYEGALREPLLYVSLFFKKNQERYYELLQQVRNDGDWELWLSFFLQGVEETANSACETARRAVSLFEEDWKSIGNASPSVLRLLETLRRHPITTVAAARRQLGVSHQTAMSGMSRLIDRGIVAEIGGRMRNRLFVYSRYLDLLNEDPA